MTDDRGGGVGSRNDRGGGRSEPERMKGCGRWYAQVRNAKRKTQRLTMERLSNLDGGVNVREGGDVADG